MSCSPVSPMDLPLKLTKFEGSFGCSHPWRFHNAEESGDIFSVDTSLLGILGKRPDADKLVAGTFIVVYPADEKEPHGFSVAEYVGSGGYGDGQSVYVRWMTTMSLDGHLLKEDGRVLRFKNEEPDLHELSTSRVLDSIIVDPVVPEGEFSELRVSITKQDQDKYKKMTAVGRGVALTIMPPPRRDFWQRTFYDPVLVKADAPALVTTVPAAANATLEATMELTPKAQFHQGGLFVYIDEAHWVKAGIEFVDGSPRLSCVVTNTFSDWSTQPWPYDPIMLDLRIHKTCAGKVEQGQSLVFEARWGEEPFKMVRIAHLGEVSDDWAMGVFAACPLEAGCRARFTRLKVGPMQKHVHSSNPGL